jgi:hypothetical protein
LATPPENAKPLSRLRRLGFVFHHSLQTQAFDAALENKTPQLSLRGFAL